MAENNTLYISTHLQPPLRPMVIVRKSSLSWLKRKLTLSLFTWETELQGGKVKNLTLQECFISDQNFDVLAMFQRYQTQHHMVCCKES